MRCKKLRYVFVPQYEGLGLNEIADFLNQHPDLLIYFPETKELRRLPK